MKTSVASDTILKEIREEVVQLFDAYVRIPSTASNSSTTVPSTPEQWDMLRRVAADLGERGAAVEIDEKNAFVYATLPARNAGTPFGIGAHVDSSPDQYGFGIEPQYHHNYDGGDIHFPKDAKLVLSPTETPELKHFIGDTVITAAGDTLLSADDKAGIAEIVTAISMWNKHPELPHPEVRVFITRDEEIGHGVDSINLDRLPRFCYTIDGSFPGELEYECFDALGVTITFQGKGVHPGFAYGKMINAALAATHFGALLDRDVTPERTRNREGFIHLSEIQATNEKAVFRMILRDFEHEGNLRRLKDLHDIKAAVLREFPGLTIEIESKEQYPNMKSYIDAAPEVVEKARAAIQACGIEVIEKPIRGGTDGSNLSAQGKLTPNIFAGGLLFHSRLEFVAVNSMVKATETILNLGREWSE